MQTIFRAVAFALPLLLGACAGFTPDGGFSSVESITREQLGKDVKWSRSDGDQSIIAARVDGMLSKPLAADDAVQIALLNNRGLQADFAALGIAEADFVSASRLPNPGLSYIHTKRGEEIEIERGVHFNLAKLLALPFSSRLESQRFAIAKGSAAMAALKLAGEARKAYIHAVAAQETVRYTRQVSEAAEAGAELARRMAGAGNWSRLQQAREQGFYADAALNVARAEQSALKAREALARLLGLWGTQLAFSLPERLPDLPAEPGPQPDIEQRAMESRLDVRGAKLDAESLAASLGLTRATRFINVLEAGVTRETSNREPVRRGYEISLELPIFDFGSAKTAKAEALYMQAVHRAAETAINARSQVRETYLGYRTSYDIARHYRDEVVPIRKRIADENLLRYNGMLIGVFELLADSRAQIASVNSYIESLRDFWLAESDLQMVMIGTLGRESMSSNGMAKPVTTATSSEGH